MKQLSSLDLFFFVKELKVIENSRVDSLYSTESSVYIKLYSSHIKTKFLKINVGLSCYLTDEKELISGLSNFVQHLRKLLINSYITSVKAVENERILVFRFVRKKEEELYTYFMYIELFQPGNVVLCDEEGMILNSFVKRKFKDRTISSKTPYVLPPKSSLSLFNLTCQNLEEEFGKSDLKVSLVFTKRISTGGKYAKEILHRAELEDVCVGDLGQEDIEKLLEVSQKLLQEPLNPQGVIRDGSIYDFVPIYFYSLENMESVKSFNELIRKYYESLLEEKNRSEFDLKKARLLKRLKQQQELLKYQRENYKTLFEKGTRIYENFSELEEILKELQKTNWQDMEKFVKDKRIVSFNKNNFSVTIKI